MPADRPSPIEPALTPEEWQARHPDWGIQPTTDIVRGLVDQFLKDDRPAAAIAVINMIGGRSRFTWEMVDALRGIAEDYEHRGLETDPLAELHAIADLIASYLPPR